MQKSNKMSSANNNRQTEWTDYRFVHSFIYSAILYTSLNGSVQKAEAHRIWQIQISLVLYQGLGYALQTSLKSKIDRKITFTVNHVQFSRQLTADKFLLTATDR